MQSSDSERSSELHEATSPTSSSFTASEIATPVDQSPLQVVDGLPSATSREASAPDSLLRASPSPSKLHRHQTLRAQPYAQASFPARSSPIGLHTSKVTPTLPGSRGYVSPIQPNQSPTGVTRRRTLPATLCASPTVNQRRQSFEQQATAEAIGSPRRPDFKVAEPSTPDNAKVERPKHRRSDSLPKFPPEPTETAPADQTHPFKLVGTVEDLPPNPKTWTPSQLALFLSHVLKLTPAPIIQDLINLVFSHGLTGRKFLRLREADLRELNINPLWARLFGEAREKLRREALKGRILGKEEVADVDEEDEEAAPPPPIPSLQPPPLSDEDRHSWRRRVGSRSRARVKEMASWFNHPFKGAHELTRSDGSGSSEGRILTSNGRRRASDSQSLPDIALHAPQMSSPTPLLEHPEDQEQSSDAESIASECVIDVDWSTIKPLPQSPELHALINTSDSRSRPHIRDVSDFWLNGTEQSEAPSCTAQAPYQSRISSHGSEAYTPIRGLPDGGDTSMEADDEAHTTIRHPKDSTSSSDGRCPRNMLSDLFQNCETPPHAALNDMLDVEPMHKRTPLRSPSGSMVLVRKKDLAELQRRMDEMEDALASIEFQKELQEALEEGSRDREQQQQQHATVWVPPSREIDSITGLSGWIVMTALGAGIVAAEVLMSRMWKSS